MQYSAYYYLVWDIYATEEYLTWFSTLHEDEQEEINFKVHLLEEFGPHLSRPHADTLKNSKISNLKELRVKTKDNLFRIAYYFDAKRDGILLTGGDKKGRDQRMFYKKLIRDSENIIELYRNFNWGQEE